MTAQGTTTVEKSLQKVLEKLESSRKMQDDWMKNGINFVDLYVDDAGGDWLEEWGKVEAADLEVDKITSIDVEAIKIAIGFSNFQKTQLLEIALSHRGDTKDFRGRSFDSSLDQDVQYKRLALLGSAILSAVVTDYLYRQYPDLERDCISNLKSGLLDKNKLSEFAISLNLQELSLHSVQGKETEKSEYKKFLGETFEAVFGAIYLECDRDFLRAGDWLIQNFIAKAVADKMSQKSALIEGTKNSPQIALKRLRILGAEILEAIAFDYLYHRFPERKASQLTEWKKMLVAKEIFPKEFKTKLGNRYLELDSDFSRTRDWLVNNFIKTTVEELVEERENQFN
jgi:dsRNA-specific ribonuclease